MGKLSGGGISQEGRGTVSLSERTETRKWFIRVLATPREHKGQGGDPKRSNGWKLPERLEKPLLELEEPKGRGAVPKAKESALQRNCSHAAGASRILSLPKTPKATGDCSCT